MASIEPINKVRQYSYALSDLNRGRNHGWIRRYHQKRLRQWLKWLQQVMEQ